MNYRHELKHSINLGDCHILRIRLRGLMRPDPHGDENGRYRIRSLYFDNDRDKALREKIDGVDEREKFRIRCYNGGDDVIRLEKKSRKNGLNSKRSTPLTREQADAFLHCDWERLRQNRDPLALELYAKMHGRRLRPKTLVEYNREAYIYPAGNVRVTFDTGLKTGLFATDLFRPDLPTLPPAEEVVLLEVKYDQFIPDVIVRLLQLGDRHAAAFSKYAACRVYG